MRVGAVAVQILHPQGLLDVGAVLHPMILEAQAAELTMQQRAVLVLLIRAVVVAEQVMLLPLVALAVQALSSSK
jgi:hypothetical protein